MHGKSGFIISPNYPVQYPANYQCTWEIVAAVGNNIQLTLEDFLLESSPNCEEDSLVIYDVGMMFHKQLCGNMRNKVFTSKGNKMILVFKSDASLQEKGFRLHYKTGMVLYVIFICSSGTQYHFFVKIAFNHWCLFERRCD